MEKNRFTFSKEERLCSKILIDQLFSGGGRSVYFPPFRFLFMPVEPSGEPYPAKVVFSVPKRCFKKAVDRNLLRRRMRESYRLNKLSFYELLNDNHQSLAIMVIYLDKEILDYSTIEAGMKKGLKKITAKLKGESPKNKWHLPGWFVIKRSAETRSA